MNLPLYGEPARLYCPAGRLRGAVRRARAGPEVPDQLPELRPLQDLRHQGSVAEHRLDDARRAGRAELPEHVAARSRPLDGNWRGRDRRRVLAARPSAPRVRHCVRILLALLRPSPLCAACAAGAAPDPRRARRRWARLAPPDSAYGHVPGRARRALQERPQRRRRPLPTMRARAQSGDPGLLAERAFTAALMAGDIASGPAGPRRPRGLRRPAKRLGRLVKAGAPWPTARARSPRRELGADGIGFHRRAAALLAPWVAASAGDVEGSTVWPQLRGDAGRATTSARSARRTCSSAPGAMTRPRPISSGDLEREPQRDRGRRGYGGVPGAPQAPRRGRGAVRRGPRARSVEPGPAERRAPGAANTSAPPMPTVMARRRRPCWSPGRHHDQRQAQERSAWPICALALRLDPQARTPGCWSATC